jgi:Holliday junction resolvase RusA-like endonuclease
MIVAAEQIYHFTVARKPFSWQRVARKGGVTYVPQETRVAQEYVIRSFQNAYPGASAEPLTCRLRLLLYFYMTARYQQDIDNLAKLVMDAGNGFIWKDDQQIDVLEARIVVRKIEIPRTEVFVFALEG